jgi:molecular chaperone DnaK (HSP70)
LFVCLFIDFTKVSKAVFTVPAHFSNEQRVALKNAASRAGKPFSLFFPPPTAFFTSFPASFSSVHFLFVFIFNLFIFIGMTPMRIVSEPTAVAIAHLHEQPDIDKKRTRNLLVFDLGGGGLNVAVVCVHHQLMELKAHARDTNLGGEAFDNLLVRKSEGEGGGGGGGEGHKIDSF